MKKARKILSLALCAILLVSATVAGTLAYLTAEESITNTFSVGNVSFEKNNALDEADVNEYGEKLNDEGAVWKEGDTLAARVKTNMYKLVPGRTYVKDPTVHLKADSEKLWLFVKVDVATNIATVLTKDGITNQMKANGWNLVDGTTDIYVKGNAPIQPSANNKDFVIFDSITVTDNAAVDAVDPANDKITVFAYIVQADGFGTAKEAWDAANFGAENQ